MKTLSDYSIYCTEDQTKKALELGAPINFNKVGYGLPSHYFVSKDKRGYYEIPTAEQMIGFLRSVGLRFHFDDVTNFWRITHDLEIIAKGWNKNKELAAINKALEYLNSNKKKL